MQVNGRDRISIPWNRAKELHDRVKVAGYQTTLVLDPRTLEANLELWPGVIADEVLDVLNLDNEPRG